MVIHERTIMKKIRTLWIAAACALLPVCLTANATAAADDAGMNKPLICAVTEAAQCQETATCVQGPANAFNLPVFFRINFQDKTAESIREGGERRTSRISKVETNGGAIILQGADETTAWIATIQASSGRMTVATVREGQAFVVFGSCTRL
jgi:hypothetical protein